MEGLPVTFSLRIGVVALAAAGLVAACGGGDGGGDGGTLLPPTPKITTAKVVGDSLADSGTFGYKFTVQGGVPTGTGSSQLWVDRIASQYGTTLCAAFSFNGSSFVPQAGCTNYAVGGGQINYTAAPTSPWSIPQQLQALAAAGFTANDLLLVDGGGNDAAALAAAYMKAGSDGGVAFYTLLTTQLDSATITGFQGQGAAGLPAAGQAYMQALATSWVTALQTQALAKGATRVAVLNIPDITLTPKFLAILASVQTAQGAPAAQGLKTLISGWVQAFNQQLATSVGSDSRVAVVDFYAELHKQVSTQGLYHYTNVSKPACPSTGTDSNGLPTYDLATCTAANLSASIPVGESAPNWWQSYVFSDDFHPTPYGHVQMANFVSAALTKAGWQ